MANRDINETTTTDSSSLSDYSVDSQTLDQAGDQKETWYINSNAGKQLGYYKSIPELKQAIDALARWTAGKGWEADGRTTILLDRIKGWGEDSFQSIMTNMIKTKKIYGDAFSEIIRDEEGTLINLKPLNPADIKIVTNKAGMIIRYDQVNRMEGKYNKRFTPDQILHLCNDRIAEEIHGISVIDACETVILARNEALTDYKKILHRNINPLVIYEIDTDQPSAVTAFKNQLGEMKENYEGLVVPKGNVDITIPSVPIQNPQQWIQYLENFFYQAVGVPKVILGGSQEYTEASSKVGYLTFEQVYMTEQTELEKDLKLQMGLEVKFNRPTSMKDDMQQNEAANTGQTNFQANDTQAGVGE
jgi:hypothetical protein